MPPRNDIVLSFPVAFLLLAGLEVDDMLAVFGAAHIFNFRLRKLNEKFLSALLFALSISMVEFEYQKVNQ